MAESLKNFDWVYWNSFVCKDGASEDFGLVSEQFSFLGKETRCANICMEVHVLH